MKAKVGREPQRVGSILERALKRMSLDGKLKEQEIWNVWNSVAGEHVAGHAQPDFMRNGILFVRVSTSPWMQQLSYMSQGIVEALNQRLGAPIVREIRFKLGDIVPSSRPIPRPSEPPHPISAPKQGISREIRKTLSPIKDVRVREILGRVILKDLEMRKPKDR
jgi:hypothetical protein